MNTSRRRHLSAVPARPATGSQATTTGSIPPGQLDSDEDYRFEDVPPQRDEIPTDFKAEYSPEGAPRYERYWYVRGDFEEFMGEPSPGIDIRVHDFGGYGDRPMDGPMAFLIAQLLNTRTEEDDRKAHEAYLLWEASRCDKPFDPDWGYCLLGQGHDGCHKNHNLLECP